MKRKNIPIINNNLLYNLNKLISFYFGNNDFSIVLIVFLTLISDSVFLIVLIVLLALLLLLLLHFLNYVLFVDLVVYHYLFHNLQVFLRPLRAPPHHTLPSRSPHSLLLHSLRLLDPHSLPHLDPHSPPPLDPRSLPPLAPHNFPPLDYPTLLIPLMFLILQFAH